MDILRQAAQQALEALEGVLDTYSEPVDKLSISGGTYEALHCRDAITGLRAALAQPEQKPVAWLRQRDNTLAVNDGGLFGSDWTPLYAHPPQRKPLTEEEIELAYREIWRDLSNDFSHTSAEWIETAIRYAEKVHGIE
jgi:hypothetical protein